MVDSNTVVACIAIFAIVLLILSMWFVYIHISKKRTNTNNEQNNNIQPNTTKIHISGWIQINNPKAKMSKQDLKDFFMQEVLVENDLSFTEDKIKSDYKKR